MTASGTVEGTWDGGVAVFRSVPFAAPPVGKHRFAAPVPPVAWEGVLDVSSFGSPPPQPDTPTTDDNWLTLAVWTPALQPAKLPVVVWFSGGGYLNCNAANPHFDGATIATAGNVVVSAHYRSGFEGFAQIDGAPANRGLLDQVAALRWVRENIHAFGGDPGNVTALGQSAGAGTIAAMLTMPAATGLFQRAILQSIPATYFAPALATDIATEICALVDRTPKLDDLVDVPPAQLVEASRTVTDSLLEKFDRWGAVAYSSTPFAPVVDGEVLGCDPWSALSDGVSSEVDLIISHTRDEYSLLASALPAIRDLELDDLIAHLSPTSDLASYQAAYDSASRGSISEHVLGDWLFRMPALHLADAAHRGGARVWLYELRWGFGDAGASHGLDTLLLFGTTHIDTGLAEAGSLAMAEGHEIAELLRSELLAFATDGDPGWEPYDPVGQRTRLYDTDSSVDEYPESTSRELWRHYRFGVLDLPS